MSSDRSSSGVRSLRAMFENQETSDSDIRAGSPASRPSFGEADRKPSKVRASFISVEKPNGIPHMNRESGSATKADATPGGDATPGNDGGTSNSDNIREDANTTAMPPLNQTPVKNASEKLQAGADAGADHATPSQIVGRGGSHGEGDTTKSSLSTPSGTAKGISTTVHPSPGPTELIAAVKSSSGNAVNSSTPTAQRHAAVIRTPKSAAANGHVAKSGSRAKSQTPSSIRQLSSRPSLNFNKDKEQASPKTTHEAPKSPARPTTSDSKASGASHKSGLSRSSLRGGRSSLTAQTASSAAKSKPTTSEDAKTDKVQKVLPIRTKPRSPTRPAKLPSHLTAPTASSTARHDATKPAVAARASANASIKTTVGESKTATSGTKGGLGRSDSTTTKPAARISNAKPIVAAEGFLARMTRPTAASSSKTHGKSESKPAATVLSTASKARAAVEHGIRSVKPEKSTAASSSKPKAPSKSLENGHAKHGQIPSSDAAQADTKPDATALNTRVEAQIPSHAEPGDKQDDTTIDSSIAGIDTPGLDAPTIR